MTVGIPAAPTNAAPKRIYRVGADRTAWRQVGRDGVVLDLRESVYFGLNHSACALWQQLLTGATHADLVDLMVATEPGVARLQAASEVSEFLGALGAEGLLVDGHPDG